MSDDPRIAPLLNQARVGLIAINPGRPLINASAFHHADGALWMTTSRFAAKTRIVRAHPEAAFLVEGEERAVVVRGRLSVLGLPDVSHLLQTDLRKVIDSVWGAPAVLSAVAGYVMKQTGFMAGYLEDLARVPEQWWPHNRVLLRLQIEQAVSILMPEYAGVSAEEVPAREVPWLPRHLRAAVKSLPHGQLAWSGRQGMAILPVAWTSSRGRILVAVRPAGRLRLPAGRRPGALCLERRHAYRPALMTGSCLRGTLVPDKTAAELVAQRYPDGVVEDCQGFRIEVERVTWWEGFKVATAEYSELAGD